MKHLLKKFLEISIQNHIYYLGDIAVIYKLCGLYNISKHKCTIYFPIPLL